MKPKPYIGVTGPVTNVEIESIIDAFSKKGVDMDSSNIPMIGYLVSYKTLNKQVTENRRYPKIEYIDFLTNWVNNRALTMIHYNTKEVNTLAEQIELVFNGIYDKNSCRALQLNVVWPDIEQVGIIKKRFPELKIVFQASHKAIEGKTDEENTSQIAKYGTSIDYVLIDPSGGRGLEFDIDSSVSLYEKLSEKVPHATIGFAGGFTGDNVGERVKKIIEKVGSSDFCIDAEGGLRDKLSDKYGDDLFNQEKTENYIREACIALKK